MSKYTFVTVKVPCDPLDPSGEYKCFGYMISRFGSLVAISRDTYNSENEAIIAAKSEIEKIEKMEEMEEVEKAKKIKEMISECDKRKKDFLCNPFCNYEYDINNGSVKKMVRVKIRR